VENNRVTVNMERRDTLRAPERAVFHSDSRIRK